MTWNTQDIRTMACRVGTLLMIGAGLVWTAVPVVEAGFTAKDVTGAANRAEDVWELWEPLLQRERVDTGYQVRTDIGSTTDLLGDDGSWMLLEEDTQLLVREFEYNSERRIRIVRLALLEGVVTADAAHFEYADNVFEIETPSVTASFKFSKARIAVEHDGTTTITIFQGIFDLKQRPAGRPQAHIRYISPKNIKTDMTLESDVGVNVDTTGDGLYIATDASSAVSLSLVDSQIDLAPDTSILITDGDEQNILSVITNTSRSSSSNVTVDGALLEQQNSIPLLMRQRIQSSLRSNDTGLAKTGLSETVDVDANAMLDTLQNITRDVTSSAVPTASGDTTPVSPPTRDIQRMSVDVTVDKAD